MEHCGGVLDAASLELRGDAQLVLLAMKWSAEAGSGVREDSQHFYFFLEVFLSTSNHNFSSGKKSLHQGHRPEGGRAMALQWSNTMIFRNCNQLLLRGLGVAGVARAMGELEEAPVT